jgi:hypothetical protein
MADDFPIWIGGRLISATEHFERERIERALKQHEIDIAMIEGELELRREAADERAFQQLQRARKRWLRNHGR